MSGDRPPRVIATLGGGFFVAFGAWAIVSPTTFYERLAVWPPYNEHFIHDIGAFQVGLGLALLFALVHSDALLVALGAVGSGQLLHAVMHLVDRDLGGQQTDPLVMGILAVALLAGALMRSRGIRRDSARPPLPPRSGG